MDLSAFPPSLRTKTMRTKRARTLIGQLLGADTTKAQHANFQGMWSETIFVTLKGGAKVVVQFRAEPLDIAPFIRARELLGDLVPEVKLLHDEELENANVWPVYLTYIEGHAWIQSRVAHRPEFRVTIMKSLGRVLARCIINETSANALQDQILPKLDRLLQSQHKEIQPFQTIIQELKEEAQICGIEKLPLFCSHMDLNQMNIIINDEGEVSGLIDWELSPPPEPFGVGLHRIHDLIGEFRDGIFYEAQNHEDVDRSFWSEILAALPTKWRKVVTKNFKAVQTGLAIGLLFHTFHAEVTSSSTGYINPAGLRALPKLLTYRVPALRGDDPSYAAPPYRGATKQASRQLLM